MYLIGITIIGCLVNTGETLFGIPDFVEWGSCPKIRPMKGLDLRKLNGLWFQQLEVPNDIVKVKTCVNNNFTWTGNEMLIETRGLNKYEDKILQHSKFIKSDLYSKRNAALVSKMDGAPESPVMIYDTDYVNYMCIQSCVEVLAMRGQLVGIHTRSPIPDDRWLTKCMDSLIQYDVGKLNMQPIKQGKGCPYWSNPKYTHIKKYEKHVYTDNSYPVSHQLFSSSTSQVVSKVLILFCLVSLFQ